MLNPTTFTITDANAKAEGVTAVTILVGGTTGGPYPNSFPITAAELTAGLPTGNFTGTLASIGETLGAGTYFAVATATNATGVSAHSPEVTFQILALPSAPTAFSLA
jgi:hypothetical protein